MPEPAERIRPVKKVAPKRARGSRWIRALGALAPKSRRGFAGAGLAAMMIGIVVNAVALQHGRRTDFPPLPSATAAVAPPPPAPTATAVSTSAQAPPAPPTHTTPTVVALAHTAKPVDGIGEYLRATSGEGRKATASAQTALAKLGFSLRSTGTMDADTRAALAEFEKSRHMAISTEITPKLLRTLAAAAAAN